MLPQNNPDRIRVVFDDHRLVANAGLLLPATLAQHLGLRELVGHHLDLGCAPGRANTGDKLLTLVASALAGGDFIDDADALRAGGTVGVLSCVVKAPSTLGTFLRSFRWGHVRQLDRVSRQLLARAWAAGAGPGDSPLTIDLDSTICQTYGLDKEGARHHSYTGARGYHPLLAIAAGTGDVLMSRLREGRANTARGAAHFLRETVGRSAVPSGWPQSSSWPRNRPARGFGSSRSLTCRCPRGAYGRWRSRPRPSRPQRAGGGNGTSLAGRRWPSLCRPSTWCARARGRPEDPLWLRTPGVPGGRHTWSCPASRGQRVGGARPGASPPISRKEWAVNMKPSHNYMFPGLCPTQTCHTQTDVLRRGHGHGQCFLHPIRLRREGSDASWMTTI